MSLDSLELQLASALQRYNTLERRAQTHRDAPNLIARILAELSTALEEVRVAHEQLVENRTSLETLQEELRRQAEKYWQLFNDIPQPYLLTDATSKITEVNKAAADLLNVSQRFLVGKVLSVFVCENRGPFLETCARVAKEGGTSELKLAIRPRERAPLQISARVSSSHAGELRWLLGSVPPISAAE